MSRDGIGARAFLAYSDRRIVLPTRSGVGGDERDDPVRLSVGAEEVRKLVGR